LSALYSVERGKGSVLKLRTPTYCCRLVPMYTQADLMPADAGLPMTRVVADLLSPYRRHAVHHAHHTLHTASPAVSHHTHVHARKQDVPPCLPSHAYNAHGVLSFSTLIIRSLVLYDTLCVHDVLY